MRTYTFKNTFYAHKDISVYTASFLLGRETGVYLSAQGRIRTLTTRVHKTRSLSADVARETARLQLWCAQMIHHQAIRHSLRIKAFRKEYIKLQDKQEADAMVLANTVTRDVIRRFSNNVFDKQMELNLEHERVSSLTAELEKERSRRIAAETALEALSDKKGK